MLFYSIWKLIFFLIGKFLVGADFQVVVKYSIKSFVYSTFRVDIQVQQNISTRKITHLLERQITFCPKLLDNLKISREMKIFSFEIRKCLNHRPTQSEHLNTPGKKVLRRPI